MKKLQILLWSFVLLVGVSSILKAQIPADNRGHPLCDSIYTAEAKNILVKENKENDLTANNSNMTKNTTKEQIEAIIATVEKLIPEFQKKPDNPWADGNVAICIIDDQGNLYGKLYGSNKIKTRGTYKIAWTKASQVWITGIKTGEFEKKIFNGELKEEDFGIQPPDFIGWAGGQPIVLKDGTKLSIGFSGLSGANDLGIVQLAIQDLGI